MFGVEALPAALFFVLLFATPLSPRWLTARGRRDEAAAVLASLGASAPETRCGRSRSRWRWNGTASASRFSAPPTGSLSAGGSHRHVQPAFGINRADSLTRRTFSAWPERAATPRCCRRSPSAERILSSPWRRSRRSPVRTQETDDRRVGRLHRQPGGDGGRFYRYGTAFDAFGGTVVLAGLLVFIASHAFGQGAVIWVFLSEIFPNRVRAAAMPWAALPTGFLRADFVDLSGDRRDFGRTYVRLLLLHDGAATDLGVEGYARNEGRSPWKRFRSGDVTRSNESAVSVRVLRRPTRHRSRRPRIADLERPCPAWMRPRPRSGGLAPRRSPPRNRPAPAALRPTRSQKRTAAPAADAGSRCGRFARRSRPGARRKHRGLQQHLGNAGRCAEIAVDLERRVRVEQIGIQPAAPPVQIPDDS